MPDGYSGAFGQPFSGAPFSLATGAIPLPGDLVFGGSVSTGQSVSWTWAQIINALASSGGSNLLPTNNTWTGTNSFNTTVGLNGGSLSGSYSGSPVFSGNPVFSGSTTIDTASITSLTAAGGSLSGTFSGNATYTGTPIFNGSPAALFNTVCRFTGATAAPGSSGYLAVGATTTAGAQFGGNGSVTDFGFLNSAGTALSLASGTLNWTMYGDLEVVTLNGIVIGNGAGIVSSNFAVGSGALGANTSGHDNVAIGTSTLNISTTASQNIAIGNNSLESLLTSQNNIGIGSSLSLR